MENAAVLYQRFMSASREPVRLELALRGFFAEGELEDIQHRTFADYLKRRIRPAMESLMKADNLSGLRKIESLGWLDEKLTEEGLDMAIRLKKTEIFIWLLGIKADKYGFRDRSFEL